MKNPRGDKLSKVLFARISKRPIEQFRGVFLGLFALNAIIISATLYFNSELTEKYRNAIKINQALSQKQKELSKLERLAYGVNAPGSKVFESKRIDFERERLLEALELFEKQLETTRSNFKKSLALENSKRLLEDLDLAEQEMSHLVAEAQYVFDGLTAGDQSYARSHMALMDHCYSIVSKHLSSATASLWSIQKNDLNQQRIEAIEHSKSEYIAWGAFAFMVMWALMFREKLAGLSRKLFGESEESRQRRSDAYYKLELQKFALDEHSLVSITDKRGMIEYANDSFCEISQYAREELIGNNHRIVRSGYHNWFFFEEMWRTIASGKAWRGEVCNKAKDQTLYWVKTLIVPMKDSKGRIERYLSIREDITSRKEDEERLRKLSAVADEARIAAEQANQSKSEFLAIMSHEIRTPMNGVIGFANLLLDGELSSSQLEYANTIRDSGEALMGIINDILDFSKIEAGKMDIEIMPFDMKQTIESSLELLSSRAAEKSIELFFNYDTGCPTWAFADPSRTRQIIVNLLGNAIKFTSEGHVCVTIEKDESRNDEAIRIRVTDTGIGIPKDQQDKLFDKFAQADSSTSRRFGGTGLGLAISKLLVELMNGEIGLESEEEKGSCFWFSLPLSTEIQPEPEIAIPSMQGKRLLIAGDYAPSRDWLVQQCSQEGANCSIAKSIEGAKDALREQANEPIFDLAIFNFTSTEVDLLAIGQEFKGDSELSRTDRLAIVYGEGQGAIARYRDAGYAGCLLKPINKADSLLQGIAKALEPASKDETQVVKTKKQLEKGPQGAYRILVVDDSTSNQSLMKTLLSSRYGYKIDIAANGHEAIDMVKRLPFDLVFMDCMMPEMDGFEATQEIRTLERAGNVKRSALRLGDRLPIVALTASVMKGDQERCFSAGMDCYLSKPIKVKRMLETLNEHLLEKAGPPEPLS